MKVIYTGLESQGKTLLLAQKSEELINRNKKWHKKYGFTRKLYSNIIFSNGFYSSNKDYIEYFTDYRELLEYNGIDVIWDEISTHFSALKKEPLPRRVNVWLRQGAKQGVDIYATAQEFHDVHLDFRRRCVECLNIKKIIGSRRSGKNLPPVKHIWGLCLSNEIKIHPYNELAPEKLGIIPGFIFITRSLCEIFDTSQIIKPSEELPYEHIERSCPTCGYKKVIHF